MDVLASCKGLIGAVCNDLTAMLPACLALPSRCCRWWVSWLQLCFWLLRWCKQMLADGSLSQRLLE